MAFNTNVFDHGPSSVLATRDGSSDVPFVMDVSKDPAPRVVASIWAMISVSTVFLLLRVYCKRVRTRGMWIDDHILIASWVSEKTRGGGMTSVHVVKKHS